ncbi:MAG: ribbon-helix-helix protein, CopG family [Candidatus Aenigmatarchaeota archaeon]
MKRVGKDSKKIQIILTKEQYELIQKLRGEMGNSNSEIVRNIVLNWLLENSFITSQIKEKEKGGIKNDK